MIFIFFLTNLLFTNSYQNKIIHSISTIRYDIHDYIYTSRSLEVRLYYDKFKSNKFKSNKFKSKNNDKIINNYDKKNNKTHEIIKLTRLKNNFFPVTILAIIAGFVTNPLSWKLWILSPPFLSAYLMTLIMTGTSMIINDIYDIDVDRINNPERPFVKGTISLFEAKIIVFILLSIYSYLGIQYLPPILDPIWTTSILILTLYTPVLKKICLIKNLTCASILSLSIPFISWSTINPTDSILPDFNLMFITSKIIFIFSLYIEILLDICDKEGDSKENINTIPVLFGEDNTLYILSSILVFSNINFIYDIIKLNNSILFLGINLSYLPSYLNLINIKKNNYSKISIEKALKQINISLILFLFTILNCYINI